MMKGEHVRMARDKIINHREAVNIVTCPVMRSLLLLGGKWKLLLLYLLAFEARNGCLRYSDFVDLVPSISARVLSSELKELEADGLIVRTMYNEIPPRVEYSLSEVGKLAIPVVRMIHTFGEEYKDAMLNPPLL
jgi:DNA-binding HxlR family transcriptional regulator